MLLGASIAVANLSDITAVRTPPIYRCDASTSISDCMCIHVYIMRLYNYIRHACILHVHVSQLHSLLFGVNTYTRVIAAGLASRRSAKALYR